MSKYIPSLNGLRALSIGLVLISHIQSRNLGRLDSPGGQIGVNIFFIISGFLITYLLLEEELINGKISLRKFYLRRTIRIFPVYYFLLFTLFLLQVANVFSLHINSWITSLTYTKYFFVPNGTDWETGHLWSLSIEEHFYLIWPIVFVYLRKYRIKFAYVILFAAPIVRIIYFINGNEVIGEMTLFQRADALMVGCLLALHRETISKWLFISIGRNAFFILVPFFLLLASIAIKRIFPTDNFLLGGLARAIGGSTGTLTNLCVGFYLLFSINFTSNFWFRFLNHNFLNFLGKLSYSLYIWQQLFFSKHIGFFSSFPVNLICTFVAAIVSYNLIEKPFLIFKQKFETNKGIAVNRIEK